MLVQLARSVDPCYDRVMILENKETMIWCSIYFLYFMSLQFSSSKLELEIMKVFKLKQKAKMHIDHVVPLPSLIFLSPFEYHCSSWLSRESCMLFLSELHCSERVDWIEFE